MRILCAYDQSAGAEKAFAFALEQARRFAGELYVLGVFEPAEASRGVKPDALAETARRQFADAFVQLEAKAAAGGVPLTCTTALGSPAPEILKRAVELGADHVVVGQRGKNSHERSTLGAVSLRVVTQSPGSVTVVR